MAEKTVSVKIDGKDHQVSEGARILEACKQAGIEIPTLCYLEGIAEEAACSVCVVEVKGAKTLLRSCVTKVTQGMEIFTNSERARKARRMNMELLLAGHPKDCFVCDRNQTCELRKIAYEMGIRDVWFPKATKVEMEIDSSSPSLIRDPNKCILCRRCVCVCANVQSVNAIDTSNRGKLTKVTAFMDKGLGNIACVNCGQCILVCPTGALVENNEISGVWKALEDSKKYVLVETAPAVRASIGEEFGMPAGNLATGKMAAALRRLGFDKVFDTQFSADLTIMEEGHELIERIKNKGVLPLITSCSPGWIKFAEHFYPGVLEHISSCKSPQQMFGSIAKTYYAQKLGIDPRNMVVVSIMPCTAKKFEAKRPEMNGAFLYWKDKMGLKENENFPDVDYVLTTREIARMVKEAGINFTALSDENFDEPLGVSTGAAVIFGATGGVMEAALRTAYEVLAGKPLEKIDFEGVRGLKGIKTAEIDINDMKVKIAIASSLSNARVLLEEVQAGKSPYAFIEIMTCPGGCLGGGGQPIPTNAEIRQKRMEAIYLEDRNKQLRKSHENPAVQALYKEFLNTPLSEMSHHLLHTHYHERAILLSLEGR
jgi:iron-only hydrogenase group A